MTIGAGLAANCQAKSDTICLPITDFDANLSTFSDYREEVKSLRQLKEDTARLKHAIANYDNVIRLMNEQKEFNRQHPADVKRWGIGPVAGYGVAGTGPNTFFGVALTYSLIRF